MSKHIKILKTLLLSGITQIRWTNGPYHSKICDFDCPSRLVNETPVTFRVVISPHAFDSNGRIYDFSFGLPTSEPTGIDLLAEPIGVNSSYLFNSLRSIVKSALDEVHPTALVVVFKTNDSERKWNLFNTIALGIAKQSRSKSGGHYCVASYDLKSHHISPEGTAVILYECGLNLDLENLI